MMPQWVKVLVATIVGGLLVVLLSWMARATQVQGQNLVLVKSALQVMNDEMRQFHSDDAETDPVGRILENIQARLDQLPTLNQLATKEDVAELQEIASKLQDNQQDLTVAFGTANSAAQGGFASACRTLSSPSPTPGATHRLPAAVVALELRYGTSFRIEP